MAHPDAECATARAATAAGVLQVVSTVSSSTLEAVAEAAPGGRRWFQLYVQRDHARSRELVQRAEAAGYEAVCLTVDLPVLGYRDDVLRHAFDPGGEVHLADFISVRRSLALTEAAESATDDADVGEVDVAVDDVGDLVAGLAPPQLVGGVEERVEVGAPRPAEREPVRHGELAALEAAIERAAHRRGGGVEEPGEAHEASCASTGAGASSAARLTAPRRACTTRTGSRRRPSSHSGVTKRS